MTDPQAQDRDFSHLHPLLRLRLLDFFQEVGRHKLAVFVTEGWRSGERQEWLYASGRTRKGGLLTYARAGQSYHNLMIEQRPCSAAIDVAVWDEDASWSKTLEWKGTDAEWRIVHEAAAKVGLQNLKFEAPHLQLPYPLHELKAGVHWTDYTMLPDPDGDGELPLLFDPDRS